MSSIPTDLRYTKDHEYVRAGADGIVTVGITDFAQGELGDVVFLIFPKPASGYRASALRHDRGRESGVGAVQPGERQRYRGERRARERPRRRQPRSLRPGVDGRLRPASSGELKDLLDASAYKTLIGESFGLKVALPHPERFASRHIGPSAARHPGRCWRRWATRRSTRLIDAVVPEEIRLRRPLALRPAGASARCSHAPRGSPAQNQVFRSYIGMGYYGTLHAAGHPAQHARESRLVHRLHALPGGDRAGPPGGAAQLPDDGVRPHRRSDRQRLAARRGDRGRRGDGDVA